MRVFKLFLFIFVAITFIVIKPTNADCQRDCRDENNPICARTTNGQVRIFENKCELEVESCRVPSAGWKYVQDGHC